MDFEFIRPQLLWLLIPWGIYCLLQWTKQKSQTRSTLIAPHLSRVVLGEQNNQTATQSNSWLAILFTFIGVIALAGPSVEKADMPVFKTKLARVLVLDMSYSMYSTDLAPDRLTQARFKTLDMLKQFKEGDTGLVAYSGDAFVVSPLTSDITTLENLIPSLRPEIMPSKGSYPLAGIEEAVNLLEGASATQGDIILITDGIEQQDSEDIRNFLAKSPYNLSVYALGTKQGAPIKLPEGGFLKDSTGQIVVPKLFETRLQKLASSQGGIYAKHTTDDSDIKRFKPRLNEQIESIESDDTTAKWRVDAGIYLLFLLVPMALALFRKHALSLCVLLACSFVPTKKGMAADWTSWFKNTDQNALSAYQQDDFFTASQADNAVLKGAALYKQGNYQQAVETLQNTTSAQGQYNLGNALAQTGKLEEAIAAYDKALNADPTLQQAKDNKALLEKLLEQQEQQQNQQNQDNQQNGDGENQQDQQSQQSDSSDQSEQQGDQNQSDQQNSQDSNSQNQPSEQNGDSEASEQSQDKQQSESEQNDGESAENNNAPDMQSEPQSSQGEPQQDEQAEQQAQPTPAETEPNDEQAEQQTAPVQAEARELTPEEIEKAQQLNQLLRKVPDDPAILLRNKMLLEAQQRKQRRLPRGVEKSW
ncbi:VWA domain-containing protein (plasmid) [Pseudoalteromonas sp. T1lg65]|uniref:vWA domain-containing protein n=1 Tax=Pseudoalteromonas sp. T1lg65 TaxID=2077101 RepID=UPI003F7ABAC1